MVVINDMENYTEFKPLFEFFNDNDNLYDIEKYLDNHYILPTLLQFLHSSNRKVYDLFKKFYGLTDETIQDEEYSKYFLIKIDVYIENEDEEDENYIVSTEFEFCVLEYRGVKVRNDYISCWGDTYDFQEFIDYYNNLTSDNEEHIQFEIDICKEIISKWKESLVNRKNH